MGRLAEMQRKLLEVCIRFRLSLLHLNTGKTLNNESLVVAWWGGCVVSARS